MLELKRRHQGFDPVRVIFKREMGGLTLILDYHITADQFGQHEKNLRLAMRGYVAMGLMQSVNEALISGDPGEKDSENRIKVERSDVATSINNPEWLGGIIDGQQRIIARLDLPITEQYQFNKLGSGLWGPEQCDLKGARCCLIRGDFNLYAVSLTKARMVISVDFERVNVFGKPLETLDLLHLLWSRLLSTSPFIQVNIWMMEVRINSERSGSLEWTLLSHNPSHNRLQGLRRLMGFLVQGAGLIMAKDGDPVVKLIHNKTRVLDDKPLRLARHVNTLMQAANLNIVELNRPIAENIAPLAAAISPNIPILVGSWWIWEPRTILVKRSKEPDPSLLDWPYPFGREEDCVDVESHPYPDCYTADELDFIEKGLADLYLDDDMAAVSENSSSNAKPDDNFLMSSGAMNHTFFEVSKEPWFDWADEEVVFNPLPERVVELQLDKESDSEEFDLVEEVTWERAEEVKDLNQTISFKSMLLREGYVARDCQRNLESSVRIKSGDPALILQSIWESLVKHCMSGQPSLGNHIIGIGCEEEGERTWSFRIWLDDADIDASLLEAFRKNLIIHERLHKWKLQ